MNDSLPKKDEAMAEGGEQALPASYTRFLDRWSEEAAHESTTPNRPAKDGRKKGQAGAEQPGSGGKHRRRARVKERAVRAKATGTFLAPRRRSAKESIKVRLAPEQLYWLRLTAARAGRKVNESMIVAAGLRVIEWLDLDWRCIDSRTAIAAALAEALAAERPDRPADTEGEWGRLEASVRRGPARPSPPAAGEPRPEPGATET